MNTALLNPLRLVPALTESLDLFRRHRRLIFELTKRQVTERHAGQVLGSFWIVGQPMILLATYVLVFDVLLNIRLGLVPDVAGDYAAFIISGLVGWLALQQALNSSCQSVTSEARMVKQVMFQLEILPLRTNLAAVVPLLVGITFLVAYLVLSLHVLPWTLVFIPVLVATQFVGMAGLGFFLGALSVYFRDLRELVLVFTVIGVYVLPAFYPPGAIPSAFRVALFLNPFSYMVWCYQDTFFYGRLAHPWAWPVFILGCLLTYAVGFLLFRKLKTTFGNVL